MGLYLGGFIGMFGWMPLLMDLHGLTARLSNGEVTAISPLLERIWKLELPASQACAKKTITTAHVEELAKRGSSSRMRVQTDLRRLNIKPS
jgi:hypothetical protein